MREVLALLLLLELEVYCVLTGARMAIVSFRGVASNAIVGATFTSISLAPASFTAGNWNGETPTNLQAIADNNLTTGTTWGRTYGGGNRGWIQADLGAFYSQLYLEIKAGIKMASGWEAGNADWFLEFSEINDGFIPAWEIKQFRAGSSEKILYLNLFTACRYIRLGCMDNGGGQGEFRWYSLRAWQLII